MIILSGGDWFGLAGYAPGPGRDAGFLYLLDEVGSTSDFLLGRGGPGHGRLCRWDGWGWQAGDRTLIPPPAHPREGSAAVARRQTSGRGRQGRVWHSEGGLSLSWVIAPLPREGAPRLAVWTGLIAVEAIRGLTGLPVELKWPNDLLLEGRKLGGLILDLVQRGPQRLLVAGLGVNIGAWSADTPADVRARAAALPADVRPAAVAGAVLARHDAELPAFLDGGWPAFRARLDARDCLRGRPVRLHEGEAVVAGTAEGIDDDGALTLRGADGRRRTVLAGDVHLIPPTQESRR